MSHRCRSTLAGSKTAKLSGHSSFSPLTCCLASRHQLLEHCHSWLVLNVQFSCDGAFGSRIDKIFAEKIQSSRPRQLVRLSMVSIDVIWIHKGVISARVAVELMRFPVLCEFNVKL